ncbi:NUDIX hydrolase [Streptomyces sp. DSM 42041]|uniref:NUDIX hydrolase n=1 Tax=Streptomyces hazeniae TaxID=3075538 RepID=A0ABU2NQ67_9ACTN|nr:NUDIX hydrolase [Streptomyces sp. DSM 42041]MDT0377748.1 NUDIX hydrolase [Streptomyces sp. DSM 42041]
MSDAEARTPLVTGPLGLELLSFHPEPEDTGFPDAAVGYALVVLRHEDRVLMVLERHRGCWEIPGGGIEPGETPREAAVRELREEAGQHVAPEDLRFAGFARTKLPDRSVLYGAVFTGSVTVRQPFTPNEEISAIRWRRESESLPGGRVQTVDEYLVARCAG